jgi:hypothetical protein
VVSTTPGRTTQPVGYPTYEQYTTALAFSVLAVTKAATSSAGNAIESFISVSVEIEQPQPHLADRAPRRHYAFGRWIYIMV